MHSQLCSIPRAIDEHELSSTSSMHMFAVGLHHHRATCPFDDMARGSAATEAITEHMRVSVSIEDEVVHLKVLEQVHGDADTGLCITVTVLVLVGGVVEADPPVRVGGEVEPRDVDLQRREADAEETGVRFAIPVLLAFPELRYKPLC